MFPGFTEILVTGVITTFGGFGGYVFGRRGQKANDAAAEIANFKSIIDIYKNEIHDIRGFRDILEKEYQSQIDQLKLEVEVIKRDLIDCKKRHTASSN